MSYNFDKFTWICSWKATKSDKNRTFQKLANLEPNQLGSSKIIKRASQLELAPNWHLITQSGHTERGPVHTDNKYWYQYPLRVPITEHLVIGTCRQGNPSVYVLRYRWWRPSRPRSTSTLQHEWSTTWPRIVIQISSLSNLPEFPSLPNLELKVLTT